MGDGTGYLSQVAALGVEGRRRRRGSAREMMVACGVSRRCATRAATTLDR